MWKCSVSRLPWKRRNYKNLKTFMKTLKRLTLLFKSTLSDRKKSTSSTCCVMFMILNYFWNGVKEMFFCEVVLLRWRHCFFYMVVSYSWWTFSGKVTTITISKNKRLTRNDIVRGTHWLRKGNRKGQQGCPVSHVSEQLEYQRPQAWWLALISVLRPSWRLTHKRLIFSLASSRIQLTTHQHKHLGWQEGRDQMGWECKTSFAGGGSGLCWIKPNMT